VTQQIVRRTDNAYQCYSWPPFRGRPAKNQAVLLWGVSVGVTVDIVNRSGLDEHCLSVCLSVCVICMLISRLVCWRVASVMRATDLRTCFASPSASHTRTDSVLLSSALISLPAVEFVPPMLISTGPSGMHAADPHPLMVGLMRVVATSVRGRCFAITDLVRLLFHR